MNREAFELTEQMLLVAFKNFEFDPKDMWDWGEIALCLSGKLVDMGWQLTKIPQTTNVLGDDIQPLTAQDWRDASDITTEGVESETL